VKDRFSMLIAGGVTAWLLVQALINVAGVVGMMPLTGLTLPFVSFGGTSLVVTMAAAGLLLNAARTAR
jgi:cell division protein FtsW